MRTLVSVSSKVVDTRAESWADPLTPGAHYLASVSTASKRAVRDRLAMLLRAVGGVDVDVATFAWHRLAPSHVATMARAVIERAAPSTARAACVALRGVLRASWRVGAMDGETLARCLDAIPAVRGERVARGRALARGEVRTLLAHASDRDRWAIALLFGAGLRRSEAVSVDGDRVADGSVRVLGKGDRERVVPLAPWAADALRDAPRSGPVLRSRAGRLTAAGLYYALRTLARAHGIVLTPHDARRTFVSELLDVADTATVAAIVGHASTEQTRRYDRRGERAARDAVGKLSL